MSKLLPCPFCGRVPQKGMIFGYSHEYSFSSKTNKVEAINFRKDAVVRCPTPGCSIARYGEGKTDEDAIINAESNWNTRH